MDLLKRELQRKRRMLESDFGGGKLLKRSEIEQKEIQKIREEEHRRIRSKSPPTVASSHQISIYEDDKKLEDIALPRLEVIRRLRLLKQPVTLFGEDDAARLRRLRSVIESGPLEIDAEMTEGQTNDFLRDIYELRKNHNVPINGKVGASGDREDTEVGGDGAASAGVEGDKDAKRMKAEFEALALCDEDKILVFFKRLLNEWNQEVEEMPEKERRTAKGKAIVATYKQCARYLEPLFKMCRKKILPDDIRQALLVIVVCCKNRDYLAAMDQYIKLAIGNSPWPIGVTMVGIHERSAREKIYTNSVAHIMNDETTRKYLQSVKRLMTFCQRRYPADPSRSVEFNSLANGSDLQSLLAEQRSKMSSSEERIQLVQAN